MLFDFVVGTLVLGGLGTTETIVARFPQDSERRVSALRRKLREIINIAKVYQVVGTKYIERATYCTQ